MPFIFSFFNERTKSQRDGTLPFALLFTCYAILIHALCAHSKVRTDDEMLAGRPTGAAAICRTG